MNAQQIITKLTWIEVSPEYAPDCRRVLREERFALMAAVKSGKAQEISAAMSEARRVCEMWGIES